MDINQVTHAIMFGNLSNEDLKKVVQALKYAHAQLTKSTVRTLRPGDAVKFTSSRNGRTYTGTVERIKIKYVIVNTNLGRFNVPANMLEAA